MQDASILEWMQTLSGLLKLDADKFVPGHGPIGSKKDVEAFLRYLEELKALVQPAVERGDSLEQVTRDTPDAREIFLIPVPELFPVQCAEDVYGAQSPAD